MSLDHLKTHLRRAVVVSGTPEPVMTLSERQRFYRVPGVSVALAVDGTTTAKAYGEAAFEERVTTRTLFQAGSISKPVTAVAVLRLVDKGVLDLDATVNSYLTSWQVPAHGFNEHVTLRRLLSHSAGVSVTGFPGYPRTVSQPTLQQVLDGLPPANTAPIRVAHQPGSAVRYSGGGLTIVQQLIEDVMGEPFANAVQHLVLDPFGMRRSTFGQPLRALAVDMSLGHTSHGVAVPDGPYLYPEQAAAGLWSTPGDLVRLATLLQKAWAGDEEVLSQRAAREMFKQQSGMYGLGFRRESAQDKTWFWHTGGTEGFRAHLRGAVNKNLAVAVMTNSESGAALQNELLEAVYERTGRMTQARPVKTVVNLASEPYVGLYKYNFEAFAHTLELRLEDGVIKATSPTLWHGERMWLAESETSLFDPDGGTPVTVEQDSSGYIKGLHWGSYWFEKAT